MYLLACIASTSFVFGAFILLTWHGSIDLRIELAGLYWLITTVATLGASLLLRLERQLVTRDWQS
jgi:hypothetical protein